jgi:endonuclease-3
MSPLERKREKLRQILQLLERCHGRRKWASRGPGLDVLVESMLAQNTNPANAASGYRQLRRRFANWQEVMDAPIHEVQRQIAICGLARMRARRLQALLGKIHAERGALDLQFLKDTPTEDAHAYLMSFFGIGPKTAGCTLLFAFGKPILPIEKVMLRIARRMRLVKPRAGEAVAERVLTPLTRPRDRYALHVLTFAHGKQFCRPRNPKCRECCLLEMCPYGQRRVRHQPPHTHVEFVRKARPMILSRFASAGIAKRAAEEERQTYS